MLKHHLQPEERFFRICDNRADAELITPDLLSQQEIPDAFFAVNDDTAIGILYSAKRMGFNVPDDISICGFTNGQRAIACDPMLTTVEQRGNMVGEEAANILINKVEGLSPKEKVENVWYAHDSSSAVQQDNLYPPNPSLLPTSATVLFRYVRPLRVPPPARPPAHQMKQPEKYLKRNKI